MTIVPEARRTIPVGFQSERLTVIGVPFYVRLNMAQREQWVVCECSCGKIVCTNAQRVRRKDTKSCGCWHDENSRTMMRDMRAKVPVHEQPNYIDGRGKTRLFRTYNDMIGRCTRPSLKNYPSYGGRGITVCEEWLDNFVAFREWAMSHGYTDNLTIERNDVNGNYCPENCCWITKQQQNLNKRNNVRVSAFGETKTVSEWTRDHRCAASQRLIYHRIYRGWEPERAITTPRMPHSFDRCRKKKPSLG